MKRTLILLALSVMLSSAFALDPVKPANQPLKASAIMIPIGNTGKTISLEALAHITPKEYAQLANKRMNFFERAGFSLGQKKLRNSIREDGTLNSKKLQKMAAKMDGEYGFHLGGFALGFFVGLIGVLIAYLINDDYKSNRVKWAWIGFGTFVVLYILLLIAIM